MVAVMAEASRARVEPTNRVQTQNLPSTLNATWILQSEGAIWVSRLM